MISLRRSAIIPLIALVAIAAAAIVFWPRGETMYVRTPVELYLNPVPEELTRNELIAGEPVTVLERRTPWARVKAGDKSGWLPEWYLIAKAEQPLPAVAEYKRVVKGTPSIYLFPDASAPVISRLDTGKVVNIKVEAGDWRYVDFSVFDVPAVSRGWLKAEDLAADGEVAPQEGRLPAGTTVYHGDPAVSDPRLLPQEVLSYEMIIRLRLERGDLVYVTAAGGWDGWVFKKDIVFDAGGQ